MILATFISTSCKDEGRGRATLPRYSEGVFEIQRETLDVVTSYKHTIRSNRKGNGWDGGGGASRAEAYLEHTETV